MKQELQSKNAQGVAKFGDVLIAVNRGMKACGRAKGVEIDEAARTLHISNPLGRPLELDLDSAQSREKATFATRLAPALYANQAGETLLYEAQLEQPGASPRYFDVTMRLSSDHKKTVAGFEVKIAAVADPRRKIEEAKGQIVDYMDRMMTAGQLAPIVSMSFVVFAEGCLLDGDWKCSEYFNAQGGPGSMYPSGRHEEFMAQCKEQLGRHGMVCATWLFDLSDKDKCLSIKAALDDKSLLESTAPLSFALPYVGEFPMTGTGSIVGPGATCLSFIASAETIGLAPTSNPSGASLLQNTRGFKQKPVEKPGEARSNVIIERVKGAELHKLDEAQRRQVASGYAGTQTGANTRRIMAMSGESLWNILPIKPNGAMLLVSTNVALSDSQSSTACFSSMAKAAKSSSTYEGYCLRMDEAMLFYGIHPEVPRKISTKMMEGCRTNEERAARYMAFKELVMAPHFDVKIEFPTTQDEATLSSQAANQVYPQSSVDLSVAQHRQSMQAMHDVGKRLAKAHGCEFPFDLPKHAQIEQSDCLPISELAQAHYTGESGMAAVYGASDLADAALVKRLEQAIAGAGLRGEKYFFGEADKLAPRLSEAAKSMAAHAQALSRCGFEGASEPKRLRKAIQFLLPDMRRVAELAQPVCDAFYEGLDELGAAVAISRGRGALKPQRELVRKEGSRLSQQQRCALKELFEQLDGALDPTIAQYGEIYTRTHFKHTHDKSVKAAYSALESDKLLRLSRLVAKARAAAARARQDLSAKVNLSGDLLARLIYASAQCSWEDGSLDTASDFASWETELDDRLAFAAERIAQKLNRIAATCGSVGTEAVKAFGKGSPSAAHYHGGDYVLGLPESWRSEEVIEGASRVVFPAYKNAATWLINAGLSEHGSWDPKVSEAKARKPVLLICGG